MKNAIIVHGRPGKKEYYSSKYPSSSNFHWIPWLQKQLIIRDIKADTPEMPFAFAPEWKTWKKEFERFEVNKNTILVGHSNGGGFLVRWLSDNPKVKVDKLVLVAPSFHENEYVNKNFFRFTIDPKLSKRVRRIVILNGLKDSKSVHKSVDKIVKNIKGVRVLEFPSNGHFILADMKSEKFPQLLKAVLD